MSADISILKTCSKSGSDFYRTAFYPGEEKEAQGKNRDLFQNTLVAPYVMSRSCWVERKRINENSTCEKRI